MRFDLNERQGSPVMSVRMKDIATDLNLSKMTISKVLRGQTDVSAKTKARVLQRVKELNYKPNISAQSLRTGRTLSIGVIVPSLSEPFFMEIARNVVQQLRSTSYSVFLSSSEREPEIERLEISHQLAWPIDALILASVQSSTELQEFAASGQTPLILVDSGTAVLKSNSVHLREQEIGRLAASHLVHIGCRRIANVRGPRTASADLRFDGFRTALAEAGQRFRPDLVIDLEGADDHDYQRGARAAERLLRNKVKPDGIVCHTDLVAVGTMDTLICAGVQVPRDTAVIGCGNTVQTCHMRLPLTSIDLSASKVGQRAAKLALTLLEQEGTRRVSSVTVSPTLVGRQSTAR